MCQASHGATKTQRVIFQKPGRDLCLGGRMVGVASICDAGERGVSAEGPQSATFQTLAFPSTAWERVQNSIAIMERTHAVSGSPS
jgi:hypothetical protein